MHVRGRFARLSFFFFSSRRRHTSSLRDWSSDVCSSDLTAEGRIGSLDSRALTDARVKEFGAYFQAVLADELRRLGVHIGYDADEQAVVVLAIPEHISKAFSKGRQQ